MKTNLYSKWEKPVSFHSAWKFSKTSQSGLCCFGLAPRTRGIRAAWGFQSGEGPRGGLFYPNGSVRSHFLKNVLVGETPPILICSCPCLLLSHHWQNWWGGERMTLRTRLSVYWMNSCQKNLACSFSCVLNGDIFLLKSVSEPQLSLLYAAISYLTLCHSVLLLSQLKAHIHPRRYIRLLPQLLEECMHSRQVRNHALRPPGICYSL